MAQSKSQPKSQSKSQPKSQSKSESRSRSASAAGVRPVAVLGGNRIPFARANSAYADASNMEMLTAALDGLVSRYSLAGEEIGEVVAGAVL